MAAVLLIALAAVVLPLAYVSHHAKRHGAGPVTWRWLSGQPLDGKWRTNATWLHSATKVLHESGNASRWAHKPRLWRAGIRTGTAVAVAAAGLGLLADRGLTLTCLAAAGLLAAGASGWLAWRAVRDWRHYRTWVRPLHLALAEVAGQHASTRPRDWLQVDRDRTRAVIKLPAGFTAARALKEHVLETTIAKLAFEAAEPKWQLEGPKPRLILTTRPAPPKKVTWADIEHLVAAAPPARPVIGLGRGGVTVALDLHESPHILLSVPTGGGKSTLLRVLIPGMLAAGGTVAAVLDVKWISHPWVKGGLPNVLLCQRIADIHTFLEWLGGEIGRRNEVAWAAMDIEGRIHGDVGPRVVVVIEELNTTTAELRRYWRAARPPGGPDLSPAVEGLTQALLMGRQVRVHVIVAGQQVTAVSVGGGAGREQFGTRILGRYTPGHWRMLAEEVERMPPSSRHGGRVQVVAGADARECQVAEITGAQAVDLARSAVTPWPPTLPLSLRRGISIGVTPADLGADVETVTPQLPPSHDAIRLSDAVALGVVHASLAAVRKASHRPGFPPPAAHQGVTRLYDPAELAAWDTARRDTEGDPDGRT